MKNEQQACRLLVVNRDSALASHLQKVLGRSRTPQYSLATYSHFIDGFTYLKVNPVDVVLVGPHPAETDQLAALSKISAAFPDVAIVALLPAGITSEAERESKREAAISAGANECLSEDENNLEVWKRTLQFSRRENAMRYELNQVSSRLSLMMHNDSLTGMLNCQGLSLAVMDELAECRNNSTDMLVLLVDLDNFCRINSSLGNGVGDLVLAAAARRIRESMRSQDLVGRCGTDRFFILLPQSTVAEGKVVAEKIRLGISRDVIQAGEHVLSTTASLGLTVVDANSISFDEVLAKAHFALQRSKRGGKNCVVCALDTADVESIFPVEIGPEMVRSLLRGNLLQVSSQPIVNLTDGRIVSREMLVRGPEGPLRRPDNLFKYCQEQDILTAVDLLCLKQCALAAGNSANGARYHVNIMPATLLQTPVEELIRVLCFDGNYGHCCLEISEQQLLGDTAALMPPVKALQAAGIRIAIDDVGFGNSCLESLLMLQPQVMKIDKRMVQGLGTDAAQRLALTRLLKIAEVLGAEVVAEGIEATEDFHALLDLGVRFGQGYLFGKPKLCQKPAANIIPFRERPPEAQAEA